MKPATINPPELSQVVDQEPATRQWCRLADALEAAKPVRRYIYGPRQAPEVVRFEKARLQKPLRKVATDGITSRQDKAPSLDELQRMLGCSLRANFGKPGATLHLSSDGMMRVVFYGARVCILACRWSEGR